ncbi:MAG: hypothetical protein N3F64_03320 [Nitrososphaeria archaeon]|nr:hypothetical protein [Nitrososphaeria archaeon]
MPVNKTKYMAFIGIFSGLWAALNLTIGPLGFTLFRLPILCDVASYFPLIVTVWFLRRYGSATGVGIIGSLVTLFLRPGATQMIGFAVSAILFDLLMLFLKHNISFFNIKNVLGVSIITLVSAYVAGFIIGAFIMVGGVVWALTVWAPLHAAGGFLSIIISYPILVALEKSRVKNVVGA